MSMLHPERRCLPDMAPLYGLDGRCTRNVMLIVSALGVRTGATERAGHGELKPQPQL